MQKLLFLLSFFFSVTLFGQYTSKDSTGKNYINFNTLDESYSCDSIQKLIKIYGSVDKIPDIDLRVFAIMGQLKCTVAMLNNLSETLQDTAVHKYQAQVLLEEDSAGNPMVLFNLLDLKTLTSAWDYAKALVDFAPVLLAGNTGRVGDFLLQSGIATAFSKYTIDAYYEAAIKSDPLIILYPAAIPAKKISREVLSKLRRDQIYDEVAKAWRQNIPGIANPIAKMSKSGINQFIKGTEIIAEETAKASSKVIKVVKRKTELLSK